MRHKIESAHNAIVENMLERYKRQGNNDYYSNLYAGQAANVIEASLITLSDIAQIPETRAILQEILQPVLDSDLAKRVASLEAEMDRLRGDGK